MVMRKNLHHNLKTLTILCLFVTLLTSVHATMYYSARSGNPTVLSNWTTCRCGVGLSPTSFNGNDTFIIQGTHTMVNINNWKIAGAQSGLFIENTGSLRSVDSINLIQQLLSIYKMVEPIIIITKDLPLHLSLME